MGALATCTVSAISGEGKTICLLPVGLFRANDGRPEALPGWILTASNATAIIQAAAAQANDFVIDYEHQTMKTAQNGQPAPAAGWFKRLEWREAAGLFAVDVRWTARASAMIVAGEYRYISPVFNYDSTGLVTRLLSAAITNTPALDGLTDIAAAKRQAFGSDCPGTAQQKAHDNEVMAFFYGDILTDIAAAKRQEGRADYPGTAQEKAHDNAVMRFFYGDDAPQIR